MPVMLFAAPLGWSEEMCKNATILAFQAGFRAVWSSVLDGAECQKAQALAISQSGLARDELFIAGTACPPPIGTSPDNCSKCSDKADCYQQMKAGAEAQFDLLGVDTLDMLFLDYPATGGGCETILGQWEALEDLYAAGRVRALAVDNFQDEHMQCILANKTATVPAVTMKQYSVGHGKDKVVENNAKHGTAVLAYSPLADGSLVTDQLCESIGAKYNKSAVQVALKWILQRNATIATQSSKLSHLQGDMDIFDFTLSDSDMQQLNLHQSTVLI